MRLLKVKGVKLKKKKKFKRNGTVAINLYTVKKQNYLDITKPWVYSVKKKNYLEITKPWLYSVKKKTKKKKLLAYITIWAQGWQKPPSAPRGLRP
jgi:hypothetical protein